MNPKICRYCRYFVYEPHNIVSVMNGAVIGQYDGFCNCDYNSSAGTAHGPPVLTTDKCVYFRYNTVYRNLTEYRRVME